MGCNVLCRAFHTVFVCGFFCLFVFFAKLFPFGCELGTFRSIRSLSFATHVQVMCGMMGKKLVWRRAGKWIRGCEGGVVVVVERR